MNQKPVILTGIRSNDDMTIGNYFGALLPLIDMAKGKAGDYEVNLFVPDLHSFTTPIDHDNLYQHTIEHLKMFVAAGLPLDNPSVHIYRQSFIPAHSELTWILDCFTGFGEMSRMTQFKDKSQRYSTYANNLTPENGYQGDYPPVTVGLFNYPVLMAVDMLLYGAKYVPVGDDQTQHLEFTRDIAERMNKRFGNLFVVPEPVQKQHEFFGNDQGLRIKDLQNPTKKMSKSDESGRGVIFLSDDPKAAAKKVMSAETDSLAKINYDLKKQPGISNLLQILSLLSNKSLAETSKDWAGKTSYGDLKKTVADRVENFLTSLQTSLAHVDEAKLLEKLQLDEDAMNVTANQTLYRVQQAVGLRSKNGQV